MSRTYEDDLVLALRVRNVPRSRIGEVLADVEAHVAASGEDPIEAFGPPDEYAVRVAADAHQPSTSRLEVLRAYPPVLGAMLFVDGGASLITGNRGALTAGEAAAFVLLPAAAGVLLTQAGRRWTVWLWVGGAATVAVVIGLLFVGNEAVLLRYPGWIGLILGLLLVGAGLALARRRAGAGGGRGGGGGSRGAGWADAAAGSGGWSDASGGSGGSGGWSDASGAAGNGRPPQPRRHRAPRGRRSERGVPGSG
jgi:hypothetical protein